MVELNPDNYKLGKAPASFHADTPRFSEVKASASLPATKWYPNWGYGEDFIDGSENPKMNMFLKQGPGWGVMGNGPCDDNTIPKGIYAYNGVGNCGWAFWSHAFMQEDHQSGRPLSKFTSLSTVNNYAEYLGLTDYTQLSSSNDYGTDLQAGLQRVQTTGFTDADNNVHKIAGFASLEVGNFAELWEGLYFGNSIMVGINFPESAYNQTSNNKPWTVVPGAQVVGGHCIQLVGHPRNEMWTVVTWGMRQLVSQQFLKTYMDEAYFFVSAEQYNAKTGESPQNYTEADLEKYLSLL